MTDTLHLLIEKYGLLAVFIGCVAEGESAAMLAGFFAHQAFFVPWQAFMAAFAGAFTGDTLAFTLGRRYANRPFVRNIIRRPGFSRAHGLLVRHPNLFVLGNRFVYGLRVVGGVAAGLSGIPVPRFLILNAISSAVWAALFGTLGYVFGLGAERLIGDELLAHMRLVLALAGGLVLTLLTLWAGRKLLRRIRQAG